MVAKKPKMLMMLYTLALVPVLLLIVKVLFSSYQGKRRATLFMLGRVAITIKIKKRSISGSRLKLSILSSWGNYVLTLYFQIRIRPVHNIKDSVPKLQL